MKKTLLRKPSKVSIYISVAWAVICLLIGLQAQSFVPDAQSGIMGVLVIGVILFLIGFLPVAVIYCIGILIWGPGYISRALNYACETKDPKSKQIKRPFLLIVAIVGIVFVGMELEPFIQTSGLNVPSWLIGAFIGIGIVMFFKHRVRIENSAKIFEKTKGKN